MRDILWPYASTNVARFELNTSQECGHTVSWNDVQVNLWLFSVLLVSICLGFAAIELVENRQRITLEPILRSRIEPGITVISDDWPSYAHLHELFDHRTVNHSRGSPLPFHCTLTLSLWLQDSMLFAISICWDIPTLSRESGVTWRPDSEPDAGLVDICCKPFLMSAVGELWRSLSGC
jgi:hypothetical protein